MDGHLVYRCRACGATYPTEDLEKVAAIALLAGVRDSRDAAPLQLHQCQGGGLGLADLTGWWTS